MSEPIWQPPADVRETTRIGHFLTWLERERGLRFETYDELHRWSVDDLDGFLAAARGRGIEPASQETYGNGVRKAVFRDPDGNEVGVGGAEVGRSG